MADDLLSSELSAETLAALRAYMKDPEEFISSTTAPEAPKEDFIPDKNSTYKEKSYWDGRFEKEESYDWLMGYDGDVKEHLRRILRPTDRILIVGCGNSSFSASIYEDGFRNIVNIDFSQVVIEKMRQKHADKPEMTWECMDMLELSFADQSFDVVIDKATMDVLMCDIGDVWDPREEVWRDTHRMCAGISRVLKSEGKFIGISFDQPHFRKRFLLGREVGPSDPSPFGWTLTVHNLGVGLGYFLYEMVKVPSQ
eukprot:GILI01033952.1.p1 GENE.GILI01033952.1~~GILI01033952.1.p1  ORF type:complete len:254 (-),score=63.02 GILI01033952.1:57-818(-)